MDNLTEKQQILLTQLWHSLNKKDTSTLTFEFSIGDIVYLKTDEEQKARMVIGIHIKADNYISYCLAYKEYESWHNTIEISSEKDTLKAML